MLETLNLAILAIVQGLTEFLPLSSSGHLCLAQHLLGYNAISGLGVELLLHAGTLVAVLAYYRAFIIDLFCRLLKLEKSAWSFAFAILLSMVPAVILGLTCEEKLEALGSNPKIVCTFLIITGALLLLTRTIKKPLDKDITPFRALTMGIAQAFAMLPGISRSGSTIATSRFLGIQTDKAAAFSFLMVVPVILGGNLLHLIKALSANEESAFTGLTPSGAILGFTLSALVGYMSVAWMVKLLGKRNFWKFGLYCLALGLSGLTYFLFFA
jgi:undecaprenyl-diphosphatase